MPDPSTLLVFAAASFALIVVPGPAVIYIVSRSVGGGRQAGLVSMLGTEAGALVHVAAAVIGLSALLVSSATAFTVVKYVGAAYLVYLGVRKLLAPNGDEVATPEATSRGRLFWQGAVVSVLNPKTATFFLAFLPQFVDPSRGAPALQVALLGLIFVLIAFLCDGAYALVAGGAAERIRAQAATRRLLERVSGGVCVGLGAAAALSGERPAKA
jgi:threonine/homoserine/homoserine lactone efflux protein